MSKERYLTATQVRERLGSISQATLWRWRKSPELNFPKPMMIRKRMLFAESDIVDWEARQKVEAAA